MHRSIIRQVESLGYAVSVHEMLGGIHLTDRPLPVPDAYVEMHAVKLGNPEEQHVARVDDIGPDALYRAACELARMVGIELDDG